MGNSITNNNASDSFQSTEFWVQGSGKCPYLRLLFPWCSPGFTTTVSIDSSLPLDCGRLLLAWNRFTGTRRSRYCQ
jgi:hypothetical protein